jgi:pimeloyl-ACP methyl ester carboxylesterase
MDTSVPSQTTTRADLSSRKRGCLFYVKRGLKWFGIILIALVLLGVAYQTIATEIDRRTYSPQGQLYTINGHQMHIDCTGEGSPTVILQGGATAESLWWYWVQNQLAKHTRVCAYDRSGLGFSEPTSGLRDGLAIVDELHTLLEQAGEPGPYVMAGHSFGAVWTRVFAAQYPREVAGLVLVDSTFVPGQSDMPTWKTANDAIQVVLWVLWHTGLGRLSGLDAFQQLGYPPDVAREIAALQSRNQTFDITYAETIHAMELLSAESTAAEDLGDLPVIVLWASESDTAQERLAAHREQLAHVSSNSVTRMIAGANHGSILGNEQYAQQVSEAIREVIEAARTGQPLTIR